MTYYVMTKPDYDYTEIIGVYTDKKKIEEIAEYFDYNIEKVELNQYPEINDFNFGLFKKGFRPYRVTFWFDYEFNKFSHYCCESHQDINLFEEKYIVDEVGDCIKATIWSIGEEEALMDLENYMKNNNIILKSDWNYYEIYVKPHTTLKTIFHHLKPIPDEDKIDKILELK